MGTNLTERSAGAVVFYRGEPGQSIQYLLLLANYWGFPKGRIEQDEKEETAALREVREESGLAVTLVPGFRQVDEYWYQRKGRRIHKEAVFFVAETVSVESKISWEHRDMVWLTFDDALARLQFPALRDLLAKANAFLLNGAKDQGAI